MEVGMDTRGAWMVGGIVGIIAALLALVLGLVSTVCCLAGYANYLVPAGAGLFAGLLAAVRADWSEVPSDQTTSAGVGLGVRAGALAAAIAAVAFFLISFLNPVLSIVYNALMYGSGDQIVPMLIASAFVLGIGAVISLVIAVVSTLAGLGLGAAGGAIVGNSKANAG